MGLLIIRITKNSEIVKISKELKAQKLTLVRTSIFKDTTAGQTYNGSVFVELEFFKGFEVTSNLYDNLLTLPVSDSIDLQTDQFAQEFSSEDIKTSFFVKTFYKNNFGALTPAPLGAAAGQIKFIDLYFQISSQYDYNSY